MLEDLKGLYAPSRLGLPPVLDRQIAETARDACDWANRRDSVLREIRAALRSGRASLGLLLLGRAEWVGLALLQRLRDAEERYCIATVELCIFECAKEVAQAAAEGLARLRGSLGDLRVQEHLSEALTAISQEFLKASEDYLQFDEDALSTQIFFDRARDWPMFYRLDCDGQGQPMEVDPQAEHHKFLTPEFPEANVWNGAELNIRALFNGDGERELRSRLRVYAENRFWEDFESCPRPADVLSHPRMSANWQAAIERLVLSSTPLARRCKSLGGRVNPAFSYAYLAVPEPPRESVHVAAFVEEVGKRLEALTELRRGDITVLHTGKPYEVFLYVVAYAFPLAALPVTRDCHDAYHSFYRDGARDALGMAHSVPLHIDSRWEGKFEDLLVYDQATA
jgi:hypothetical protein